MTASQNIRVAVALALGTAAPFALATNGDHMLGLTAIQNGMAGAVVAAPQEASTILVNPAGMAELDIKDVRFDLGLGFLNPPRRINGFESDSNVYMMPTGAAAFRVNDKLTLGMGIGGLSGMGVDFADIMAAGGNQFFVTTKQFFKVAPGFAYRVSDQLSVGATLNLNYQSLAMANSTFSLPQNQVFGWGVTAGLIWKFNKQLQLGASWSSKQKMSDFEWNTAQGKVSMRMDGPQTLAVGLAWRPSPGLLVEADVKKIWFNDVMNSIPVSVPAGSPVPSVFNFGWSNQTVYALGVQKDIGDKMQVRAGFNYGKSPIGPEDVTNNYGSLAVVEKHLALGVSRKFSDKVTGSLSYVHAFKNSVTSNTSTNTIELKQNLLNFQVSYQY
jgi:long-chain fatty acid transport protein